MIDARHVMESEWMMNGNINEFVKADPDADRLGLVSFPFEVLLYRFLLTTARPPQLRDVGRGLDCLHGQGLIHGNLRGVIQNPLPNEKLQPNRPSTGRTYVH